MDTNSSNGLTDDSWFQRAGQLIESEGIFIGCPLKDFARSSRDPFELARARGLRTDSMVLEIGGGCLRVGYWFIEFLEPSRYCCIEPNERMLAAGRKYLLGNLENHKEPVFDTNDSFDFAVFERRFDFLIAFSIWTHAAKPQIETMLEQFSEVGSKNAQFIASFLPAVSLPVLLIRSIFNLRTLIWSILNLRTPWPRDYTGTKWVGRSHHSEKPGMVAHNKTWIVNAASRYGLNVEFLTGVNTLSQSWLVVRKG